MKILFLCTANSCRSILCEAVFNHLAPEGMNAYSAGSQPKGEVHPLSLYTLENAGMSTLGLFSKSSDVQVNLAPDFVITVCDKADGEACPVFFGSATKAHWGLADPSEYYGTQEEIEAAFEATLEQIKTRIEAFLAIPLSQLSAEQLKADRGHVQSQGRRGAAIAVRRIAHCDPSDDLLRGDVFH
jgi:arsenate reductase